MKPCYIVNLTFMLITACQNNTVQEKYIAKVGNITISDGMVDNLIEQELYGAVQRIYFLRKTAAEELVNKQLITMEAKERKISEKELLKQEVESKITEEQVEAYIKKKSLEKRGIPNLNNGYRLVNVRSEEGRQLVKEDYRNYLRNQLYESLKKKYPVEINLQAPKPPAVSTGSIPIVHYRGNLHSPITLLEVSDMDCENCRTNAPIYEDIYEHYKDKVRFGFTHFSGGVTLSATMAEAAAEQGKFWEAHDALFAHKLQPTDTTGYLHILQQAGINTVLLRKKIRDPKTYQSIKNNIQAIRDAKIFATPTVLINGQIVPESFNKDAIVKELEYWISKKNSF